MFRIRRPAVMSESPGTTPPTVPRNIPPRTGTPGRNGARVGSTPVAASPLASREQLQVTDVESVPDQDKARVLRRHLVSREERSRRPSDSDTGPAVGSSPLGPAVLAGPPPGSLPDAVGSSSVADEVAARAVAREDSEPFPIPYHTEGGDVT